MRFPTNTILITIRTGKIAGIIRNKEELNFINSEYIIKKKVGKNTHGIEQYFKFIP